LRDLRASTASCFVASYPIITLILCIVILQEKFYSRYAAGFIVCFMGMLLIVMNENQSTEIIDESKMKFIRGIMNGLFHTLSVAMVMFSAKIITGEKIQGTVQLFYCGISGIITGIVFAFVWQRIAYSPFFIMISVLNGFLFTEASFVFTDCIKILDLSKTTPMPFILTLTVFACSIVFGGEPLYLSDVIGAALIVSFNIYDSYYPVK
jgi:drug/metabolite transporter (DMT)-like permease